MFDTDTYHRLIGFLFVAPSRPTNSGENMMSSEVCLQGTQIKSEFGVEGLSFISGVGPGDRVVTHRFPAALLKQFT